MSYEKGGGFQTAGLRLYFVFMGVKGSFGTKRKREGRSVISGKEKISRRGGV